MRLLLIFLSCPECEVPAEITDRSPPAAGGWQRDRASANQTVVIVVGRSSHATHRVAGVRSPSAGPILAGALGDRAACAARECSFGVVQINAQQMVPGEYWRGPDRRPEHRLVIITGATRPAGARR